MGARPGHIECLLDELRLALSAPSPVEGPIATCRQGAPATLQFDDGYAAVRIKPFKTLKSLGSLPRCDREVVKS
jgi:hypothetical protein